MFYFRCILHYVIEKRNYELFRVIVKHKNLDLDIRDSEGHPILWYALNATKDFTEGSYAAVLVKQGASPDSVSY